MQVAVAAISGLGDGFDVLAHEVQAIDLLVLTIDEVQGIRCGDKAAAAVFVNSGAGAPRVWQDLMDGAVRCALKNRLPAFFFRACLQPE